MNGEISKLLAQLLSDEKKKQLIEEKQNELSKIEGQIEATQRKLSELRRKAREIRELLTILGVKFEEEQKETTKSSRGVVKQKFIELLLQNLPIAKKEAAKLWIEAGGEPGGVGNIYKIVKELEKQGKVKVEGGIIQPA